MLSLNLDFYVMATVNNNAVYFLYIYTYVYAMCIYVCIFSHFVNAQDTNTWD